MTAQWLLNLIVIVPLLLLLLFEVVRSYVLIPKQSLPTKDFKPVQSYCIAACINIQSQCQEWNSLLYPKLCVYVCDTLKEEFRLQHYASGADGFDCAINAIDACAIQTCGLTCTPIQIL